MIDALAVAVCAVFLLWFLRRARIGARTRAVAGVQLRFTERLRAAPVRAIAVRVIAGGLLGMFAGGATLGVVGCAGGAAWELVARTRAARAYGRLLAEQLPDLMRTLAAGLRSGRSLPQALEAARDEAVTPLRGALDATVGLIGVGSSLDEALDAFAGRAGSSEAHLVVETLKIGRAAGANLPAILDVAVESLAERDRIARDRRAAAAQAKMSAIVVAAMPVAFFAMVGSGARDQVRILIGDPIGWALLGAGVTLEAGGALWMRALLRPR